MRGQALQELALVGAHEARARAGVCVRDLAREGEGHEADCRGGQELADCRGGHDLADCRSWPWQSRA